METIMTICAFGTLGSATIGLLLLAIGFLSERDWAYRTALACGSLCLIFMIWFGLFSQCI